MFQFIKNLFKESNPIERANGTKYWYLNGVEYEPQDLEIEIGGMKMKKKT